MPLQKYLIDNLGDLSILFEGIMNSIHDAVFLISIDDNNNFFYEYVNEAYKKQTGIKDIDQVIGKTPVEVFDKKTGGLQVSKYQECFKTKKELNYQESINFKEDDKTWLTTLFPIVKNDKVVKIIGASKDISKRKEVESALVQSEKFSNTIMSAIPDIIVRLNRDGKFLDINAPDELMLYIAEENAIGKNISETLPREVVDRVCYSMEEAIATGKMQRTEYKLAILNGEERYFEARLVPTNNDEVISIIRDITENKENQEKINQYTAEVELKNLELENLYNKLDEELQKAKQIHERILPESLPELEQVSFGAHHYPAERLGGDFYDVMELDEKIVFYLSDVTGHSLEGAMMSVFVKNTIQNYVNLVEEKEITPEKVLKYLSDQFGKENYPDDYFICIFVAVLDLNTLELTYSGVGFQTPPLLVIDEKLKELKSQGLPISKAYPADIIDFGESSCTLTEGATLLIYTDGLTEQENMGKVYDERLRSVFYDYCYLSPEFIVEFLNEDFRRFNGGSLQGNDDITFLVMQINTLNTL
ncbi:SpoIIE family protein phosphatase [Natranaerofaba carboxydovora]|uniref:SpoIIE family protein phosphatase n=1 Tax=Natranaerofaba carboxydovora TaxID=2742683 RepID=UPI001F13C95B|nr:SpoIIE family protein phosphatase [Natranaerofaba carboxydovora]UMZ74810.1 Phosphoserine phosphatase RsbU [Natranaerofaba carboxydovora]